MIIHVRFESRNLIITKINRIFVHFLFQLADISVVK